MVKRRLASTALSLALVAILLLALGLLASAGCGSGETKSGADGADDKQMVIDEASVAQMSPAGFRIVLTTAAYQMSENLGGDDAGLYAVLLAVDRGYDPYQLLTGALNNQLEADGRILSSDGSGLSPARVTERIIYIPGDQAESDPQGVAGSDVARPEKRRVLLASTSGAVFLAYSGDLEDATVTVADIRDLPIGDILDVIETNIEEEYAKTGDRDLSSSEYKRIIAILALASRGYNSQQIMEAAILKQIRVYINFEEHAESTYGATQTCLCWYVEHNPGEVLKPASPPLNIFDENCPAAGPTAVADLFDPDRVRETLDEMGLGEFTSPIYEPDSGAGDEAPGDGQESPAQTREDLDGIKDGVYRGKVYYNGQVSDASGWLFDFPQSTVELVVTDEGISATVEFVQRWSAYISETNPCIATVRLRSVGQGPVTNPLSLTMEPVIQEVVGLEGKDCGDYQKTLDEWAVSGQTRLLIGTFSNGRFEGNMGKPYGVWAETGD